MRERPDPAHPESGIALVAALSMLVLFALLGTAYVGYMTGEFDRTRYEIRTLHVRQLAEAGIGAAIGELQQTLARGETPGESFTYRIPVYDQQREATYHDVSVTVSDEAARINLNLAPREVLEALGMDRSQIRDLKRDQPRGNVADDSGRRWLVNTTDIQQRGYVGSTAFATLDQELLTTFSANPSRPESFINLNTASPAVLAAVLNVPVEEAGTIAEKRPFTSWDDALTKIGHPAETFNIRPDVDEVGEMPASLALNSRCFRLTSQAAVATGGGARRIRHTIETVVELGQNGNFTTRYWQSYSGQLEDEEPLVPPGAEYDSTAKVTETDVEPQPAQPETNTE